MVLPQTLMGGRALRRRQPIPATSATLPLPGVSANGFPVCILREYPRPRPRHKTVSEKYFAWNISSHITLCSPGRSREKKCRSTSDSARTMCMMRYHDVSCPHGRETSLTGSCRWGGHGSPYRDAASSAWRPRERFSSSACFQQAHRVSSAREVGERSRFSVTFSKE